MKNRLRPLFVSLIVIGSAATAQAASLQWKGLATGLAGGTSETWDTNATANWWDGAASVNWPAAGTDDDAVFAGTAGTVTISGVVIANDIAFNINAYTVSGGTLTLNGTTPTITTPVGVGATISSVLAGSAGLTKTGADNTGILTLTGNNTLTGTVNLNAGVLRLTHSNALGTSAKTINLNGGSGSAAFLELRLDPGTNGSIVLPSALSFSTATNSGNGIRNKSGNNEIKGNISVRSGLSSSAIGNDAGTLTLSGTISAGSSGRTLFLNGNSANASTATGAINNGSGLALSKGGSGTWIFTNNNNYAGGTTVTSGKLLVTNTSGLGTGSVSVTPSPANATASVEYAAASDAPLTLSTLAITGGTGTAIGGSIGSTTTSASINVTGAATISNAAHTVNIHGVPGVLATDGTYTLISGGSGSSLEPAAVPTIGKIYNSTSFTVGALSRNANTLSVAITAAAPLATAYWTGNLAGSTKVWSVSNGTTSSNWKATAGAASSQALIPGSITDVVISATTPDLAPIATVLGANMSIKSLTISDTTNGLGLNADGYTLTLASGGITMDSSVPASTIAAEVALGASQTWTNNSLNDLTVSGTVSGANALTKAGSGTLVLSSANTYSGNTRVAAGTLALANLNALDASTLDMNTADAGSVSFTVAGTNTYNIGGLTGTRAINAGGNTLSVGGNNITTEYGGVLSNGSLVKAGTGTLILSGVNDYSGDTLFGTAVGTSTGILRLANSDALGNGKLVSNNGNSDTGTVELIGGINIANNIDFFGRGSSATGSIIRNISGDNELSGVLTGSFNGGNYNFRSDSGTLTISNKITTSVTGRLFNFRGVGAINITGVIEDGTGTIGVRTLDGGTYTLGGTNTYSLDTTVSNSTTLSLASTGQLRFVPIADGSSNKITGPLAGTGVMILNGAFNIDLTGAAAAPDLTSWMLVDVDNVDETFDTNFTVTGFTETALDSKIWKKTVGASTYTFTEGDGLLVKTAAATNTYTDWLTANAPATGFITDTDNDGVANGVENVLGTNPNVYSAGLTNVSATASSATYKHTLNPTVASDVTYSYEWSTDLVEWKASTETNTGGTTAIITPSAPAAGVVTVTTAITSGPAAKLFTRIKASNP